MIEFSHHKSEWGLIRERRKGGRMYNKRIKPQQKGGEALKRGRNFSDITKGAIKVKFAKLFLGREARHRFSFR
jgi:hypothetical protein